MLSYLFLFLANVRTTVISLVTLAYIAARLRSDSVALYGIDHQHNEPRRYGHRHRFAGGRRDRGRGKRVQAPAGEPA